MSWGYFATIRKVVLQKQQLKTDRKCKLSRRWVYNVLADVMRLNENVDEMIKHIGKEIHFNFSYLFFS